MVRWVVWSILHGPIELFLVPANAPQLVEMFYLTTHSTHFIYGYMASDIWLRTILIMRKETRCRHIGYSFRLTARVLLYAPSHRQDSTYHGICRGALAGTRNSSMGPPHEGSIRRPIAPWANALTTELHLAPLQDTVNKQYCISKLIVIDVAREIVLWMDFLILYLFILFVDMWLRCFCLREHQSVNELYSGCFVISGYREIIIFAKMAIPMK